MKAKPHHGGFYRGAKVGGNVSVSATVLSKHANAGGNSRADWWGGGREEQATWTIVAAECQAVPLPIPRKLGCPQMLHSPVILLLSVHSRKEMR